MGYRLVIDGDCSTDIGIVRESNQDAVFFEKAEQNGKYFVVGAVCDGIGGLECGEYASALVIEGIRSWYAHVCSWIDIAQMDGDILFAHVKDAAEEWNAKLHQFCSDREIKCGTTLSLLMILRDMYYLLHVGDSRIYCYQSGMRQLTVDDTVIRIKNQRKKAFLCNYIGMKEELVFSTGYGQVKPGMFFLFCSDGFYHKLTEGDMSDYLEAHRQKRPVCDICRDAIAAMEKRQERDNISVGMVFVSFPEKRLKFNFLQSGTQTIHHGEQREQENI